MNDQHPQLSPDDAKASLGIATRLQDQLLPKAPPTPDSAPTQEQKPETPKEAPKEDIGAKMAEFELAITKKLDDIRKEIKDDQQREMDGIKNEIKSALTEEDNEETKA